MPDQGCRTGKVTERPVLTIAQVYALADTIDPRYRALVLLGTLGSLRWGELATLRRTDIDLKAFTIRVERQLTETVDGGSVFGPTQVRRRTAHGAIAKRDRGGPRPASRPLRTER
jgi:integrase